MYATWITYAAVTDMGVDKEKLKFSPANTCSTYSGTLICMDTYAHLNSPVSKIHGRLFDYSGGSTGGGVAWHSFATRPALYQEGTPE